MFKFTNRDMLVTLIRKAHESEIPATAEEEADEIIEALRLEARADKPWRPRAPSKAVGNA